MPKRAVEPDPERRAWLAQSPLAIWLADKRWPSQRRNESRLAKATGISRQAINNWHRGLDYPLEESLRKLAKYWNVSYVNLETRYRHWWAIGRENGWADPKKE